MGSNLFSFQGWSNLAFWAQIAVWTFGVLGVASGITLYWAKDNATFLKEQAAKAEAESERVARGPRLLTSQAAAALGAAVKVAGLNVLVVQLGDPEASNYAKQFIEALAGAGVPTRSMAIGMMATYGIEVWGSGPDVETLVTVLNQAGIQAKTGFPALPVPASIRSQFDGFTGLVVGLKPTL